MSAAVPAAPWRDRSWRRFPALLAAAFSITTLGFFGFARLLEAPPVLPVPPITIAAELVELTAPQAAARPRDDEPVLSGAAPPTPEAPVLPTPPDEVSPPPLPPLADEIPAPKETRLPAPETSSPPPPPDVAPPPPLANPIPRPQEVLPPPPPETPPRPPAAEAPPSPRAKPRPPAQAPPRTAAPPATNAPPASPATANAPTSPSHAPQSPSPGGDRMGARAIYQPKPEIPEALRHRNLAAVAIARFRVAVDGTATVELLQPTGDTDLNKAILDALRTWRFFPAMQEGKPVASVLELRLPIEIR